MLLEHVQGGGGTPQPSGQGDQLSRMSSIDCSEERKLPSVQMKICVALSDVLRRLWAGGAGGSSLLVQPEASPPQSPRGSLKAHPTGSPGQDTPVHTGPPLQPAALSGNRLFSLVPVSWSHRVLLGDHISLGCHGWLPSVMLTRQLAKSLTCSCINQKSHRTPGSSPQNRNISRNYCLCNNGLFHY